jgi:hypothetical protein
MKAKAKARKQRTEHRELRKVIKKIGRTKHKVQALRSVQLEQALHALGEALRICTDGPPQAVAEALREKFDPVFIDELKELL